MINEKLILFNGEWYPEEEMKVPTIITKNNIGGFLPIEIDESRLNDILEYSKMEKIPHTYHIEKRNNKYYLV